MSRTAGDTTDILLARVNQAGDVGVDQDFAITILSYCQKLINERIREVKDSTSFSTSANTLIYSYRSSVASARDIISIKEGSRELKKVESFNDFSNYDPDWFTQTGTRFEAWMQLGRDLLIIYPAKTSSSSVTLTFSKRTGSYTDYTNDYNTDMDLADDDIELALSLAEIVLLVRYKKIEETMNKIERFKKEFKEYLNE